MAMEGLQKLGILLGTLNNIEDERRKKISKAVEDYIKRLEEAYKEAQAEFSQQKQ